MQKDVDPQMMAFAIKRISRDIQELQKEAIPWVSICIPNPEDPFFLHGNVMIQDGPYKEVLIHLIIRLPSDYPLSPPAANIAPGHPFTGRFHEHIIESGNRHGAAICTDLLSSFQHYFKRFVEFGVSGWSPVYTLSSILMQLQVFFADPDLPKNHRPTRQEIENMKKQVEKYELDIKIHEGDSVKTVTHSYNNPFPPFHHGISQDTNGVNPVNVTKIVDEIIAAKISNEPTLERVKEIKMITSKADEYSSVSAKGSSNQDFTREICSKLICPVTKETILSDPMPLFGYPIMIRVDRYYRLIPTPVIEIVSKEGMKYYTNKTKEIPFTNDCNGYYKSVFGSPFNCWLPLYINQEHFSQIKGEVVDIIRRIYNLAVRNEKSATFFPAMILKVLPPILVKTVIQILQGSLHQSLAALDAYCQLYWLFMNLVRQFPEVQQLIDQEVENFLYNKEFRHKDNTPDLGEFMFKLSVSKYSIYNTDVNEALLAEFLTRQVTWALRRDALLRRPEIPDVVTRFMKVTTVACQFFLIQFETTKLMVNDSVRAELEEGYGIVKPGMLDIFMNKMNWIRKNMNEDWRMLIKNIGLENVVTSEEKMRGILKWAFDQEEEEYARRFALKCSVLHYEFNEPSNPIFGYTFSHGGGVHLEPKLVCNRLVELRKYQWLPLYLNKDHFERAKNVINENIKSLWQKWWLHEPGVECDVPRTTVKLFCWVLFNGISRVYRLGRYDNRVRIDNVLLGACIQILWTFWKLLEQNLMMRQLLDKEVEQFRTNETYRKNIAWWDLPRSVIKLFLSEKGNNDWQVKYMLLEEMVSREVNSFYQSFGDQTNYMYNKFNNNKFAKFHEHSIKQILVCISITKTILSDKNRAQLETNSGSLRRLEFDELRTQIFNIAREKHYRLWRHTLKTLDLKESIKEYDMMSSFSAKFEAELEKERLKELERAKKREEEVWKKLAQTTDKKTISTIQSFGNLGFKFPIKVNKKKQKTNEKSD